MPAVITDYKKGYGDIGRTVGGGIASAGKTVGEAVARAPKYKQDMEKGALDIKKAQLSYDQEMKMIEAAEKDDKVFAEYRDFKENELIDRWSEKYNLSEKDAKDLRAGFKTLSKNGDKGLLTLGEIEKNAQKYDSVYSLINEDAKYKNTPVAKNLYRPNFAMLTDLEYDNGLDSGLKSAKESWRKDGFKNTVLEQINNKDNPPKDRQEVKTRILGTLGVLTEEEDKTIDTMWEDRGKLAQQKTGRMNAEANVARTAQAGGEKPKDNKSEYIRIREATNREIGDFYAPGEDDAKDKKLAKNVTVLQLMGKDSSLGVQEADQKAIDIVDKMSGPQISELLSTLKSKKNLDSAGEGFWSKIGKIIGGVVGFGPDSTSPPQAGGTVARGPAASPQATAPSQNAFSPDQIERAKQAINDPSVPEDKKQQLRKALEAQGISL